MPIDASDTFHIPVMVERVLSYLAPMPGKTILDATAGGGGHSSHIAARLAPGGRLICLDRDSQAIARATERLAPFRSHINIILRCCEFSNITRVLSDLGDGEPIKLGGALFDLGVSSFQLDNAPGFSFKRRDDYLDMRMGRQGDTRTAAALLTEVDEVELARILWEFGGERFARKIARQIVARRESGSSVETSGELAAIVEAAIPRAAWPRSIHPATKTFQAIRICVNYEIDELRTGLEAAIDNLAAGGRIVVISYHSVEDAIVKSVFARRAGRQPGASGYSPAAMKPNDAVADLSLLTRKPVIPDEDEVRDNHRSRSAKLRAAQRLS